MKLTPYQESVILEHMRDRWWRISHLYMIRDESARVVPFVPRPEQEKFFRERRQRNFILKARKLGMSTLLALDALDACLFNAGEHAAIVDRKEDEAQGKLAMARLAWQWLDKNPDPAIARICAGLKNDLRLVTDTQGELAWSNGSRFEAGVSLRGGTPQRLHVSELGYIASHDRKRAEEIKAGSINAVPTGGEVTIETTHEGGKSGVSYEFARLAMDCTAVGGDSPLDWQFFFFPWYDHPGYRVPATRPLDARTTDYFAELKARHGIDVDPEQQTWYQAKRREQREAMYREFPTTPDEAFRAIVSGAIYPQMLTLRATGRVTTFEHENLAPLYACWDLGVSDYTAIWLVQVSGREILWLDWHEDEGRGVGHYAEIIRAWERRYGKLVAAHFLPHDADTRERGSGKSCVQHLAEAGLPRHTLRVVPRTPDRWRGINVLRDLLPRSVFHLRCDQPRLDPTGRERLSGVGCLEAYHSLPVTASGIIREEPAHDESSHTADAARTFAEAWDRGFVDGRERGDRDGRTAGPPAVKTGYRGRS